MAKTLSDILSLTNFYLGKFSADTADEKSAKIKAINNAKDIIVFQLGLPSSERTAIINFTSEKETYLLPSDFLEPISLFYDETAGAIYKDANLNSKFVYLYPEELRQKGKESGIVYWGIDYSDGTKKLFVKGQNIRSSLIISNCDDTTGFTASNDATGLTRDTIKYITGSASIQFKIDETLSANTRATIKFTPLPSFDLSAYQNVGTFLISLWMDNPNGVSSVSFRWATDSSNYWVVSQSQNADGKPFQATSWNDIVFNWKDATQIGNPDSKNITFFQIDIDYNEATFVSPQFWNLDRIILVMQDRLVLTYYSENVVKDGTSGELKKDFVNDNDIALFADIDASLINLVAQWAAFIYNPLVNQNQSQLNVLTEILNTTLLQYQFRFPKRTPIYYRGQIKGPELRWQ